MPIAFTITTAGRAALVNAENTGTAPRLITQCGVSPTDTPPTPVTTSLAGETKRLASLSGDVVADDTIHLIIRDESADVYTVRSLALYLEDGTLFALYSQPDPILEKAAASLLLLAVDITFADVAATSLTFGDASFLNPPATTTRQGVVELATPAEATAGTDALRAVTPKAGKDAVTSWLAARFGALDDSNILAHRGTVQTDDLDALFLHGVYTEVTPSGTRHALLVFTAPGSTGTVQLRFIFDGAIEWRNRTNGLTWSPWRAIWTAANSGAGSGLDADKLDGEHAAAFAKLSGASFTGAVFVPNGSAFGFGGTPSLSRTSGGETLFLLAGTSSLTIQNAARTANLATFASSGLLTLADGLTAGGNIRIPDGAALYSNGRPVLRDEAGATWLYGGSAGFVFRNASNTGALATLANNGALNVAGPLSRAGQKVWDEGNDGAGSGLDADKLDGEEGAFYRNAGNLNAGTVPLARLGLFSTVHNVLAARTRNVTYTNTTGKIMFLSVSFSDSGASFDPAGITVAGIPFAVSDIDKGGTALFAIVPPGATYSVTGNNAVLHWVETY